jgi:hypothetical protein
MPGVNWHTVHGFGVLLVERPDACIKGNMRDGRPSRALGLAGMLKKSLRANYRRKLSHVVVLADGTKLVTLRDAANVLLDTANARSGGSITRSVRC